jgi:hypothetical protein
MNSSLQQEIEAAICTYAGLEKFEQEGIQGLTGELSFIASVERKETITASYEIAIFLPILYPDELPKVFSKGHKLDERFEHVNPDGSFCLAVPVEERKLYDIDPTLLGFINNLVVPFLYGYSYFLKYGEHPFGERTHGNNGVLDFYQELFGSNDIRKIILTLYKFSISGYKPHESCPCGSGAKVLRCHKLQVKELLKNRALLQQDLARFIDRGTEQ